MERLDMDQFDAVYARMLFVSRRRTQAELAELLNLQQGSISEAKKRGIIPLSWCVKVSDLFNVRMDWLRFGEPPVFMSTVQQKYEPRGNSAAGFRQPPPPLLEGQRLGEMAVHSTVISREGVFPEVGREVFPLEFTREGVEIFRILEAASSLNAGALVAVVRDGNVDDGVLVAVRGGSGLQFCRVNRTERGYGLRLNRDDDNEITRLVSESDWPDVYYGRAIWAFQPL